MNNRFLQFKLTTWQSWSLCGQL